jgi:hypothetical protein
MEVGVSNPSSRKGAQYELDLVEYLRSRNIVSEHIRKAGTNDQGDGYAVTATNGWAHYHMWEAKAEKTISLPAYLRELESEQVNFRHARRLTPDQVTGLVIVKARYKPIGQSYVVRTLDDYFGIGESA